MPSSTTDAPAQAAAVTIELPPTIQDVLAGINGLGAAKITKALDATEVSGSTDATPEQIARAADVTAGKKDGLKGNALATWIITGQDSQAQAETARLARESGNSGNGSTPSTPSTPKAPEFTWPKPPAEIVLDYLKSEVTADADAPNRGAPFIDAKGIVRFTGTHFREWCAKQGMNPTKNQAGAAVREAGIEKMRPFALPGEGRQMGFYTGKVKGTGNLPRRVVQRAPRSTRGGTTRKRPNPFNKFSPEQIEYLRVVIAKGRKGEVKDQLLAALPAAEAPEHEHTEPTPEEGGLPAGGPSSDTRWRENEPAQGSQEAPAADTPAENADAAQAAS